MYVCMYVCISKYMTVPCSEYIITDASLPVSIYEIPWLSSLSLKPTFLIADASNSSSLHKTYAKVSGRSSGLEPYRLTQPDVYV